ncbi:hypothetical protein AB0O68_02310 [Streptomyces sp. NPDC087512]|uniref:hypothetical protein n=1 Tax=Streptomyces sp. NPDC087512 TaxID=3155059 RepID=UPI0034477911
MHELEPSPDAVSWKAALLDLFGGARTFALVGPRRHEDWCRDAAAVMARRTTDPRYRASLDRAPEINEDRSGIGAPFMPWSPEQLRQCLYEVGRRPAGRLLVALRGENYRAVGIPDFERRKDSLFGSSRSVLSRFGPDARFFTNASAAQDDADTDLLNATTAWDCLSVYTTDCGLITVSDTEIGVFWAFWEG